MKQSKERIREMYHGDQPPECDWCGATEKLKPLKDGVYICEECQGGFVEETIN
jgi:ribosomal protein L37AE/L43A